MTKKEVTIDFIRDYCAKNNQQGWYNAEIQKQMPCKVYPKITNAEGKKVTDKSQPYSVVMRPITFIQLQLDFINAFMPELAPKAKSEKSKMFQPL